MDRPKLYIHYRLASHFIRWELPEFRKYFNVVDTPSEDSIVLGFGPDVLEEVLSLPALKRFIVLFPGFGQNPLHDLEHKKRHRLLIKKYDGVFINPGPLEIAYKGLKNVFFYPFSVDIDLVEFKRYRKRIDSLIHVSSPSPQKDWERSEAIMKATGLKYKVFPPRNANTLQKRVDRNNLKNKFRRKLKLSEKEYLPFGYFSHKETIREYRKFDAFVHVARDIKDPGRLDGKYTASLIEAGLTGAIIFWHDTYGTGNTLSTVFELPLDPIEAAEKIHSIRTSINVSEHSKKTRKEMLETFNPQVSVKIRAEKILELL